MFRPEGPKDRDARTLEHQAYKVFQHNSAVAYRMYKYGTNVDLYGWNVSPNQNNNTDPLEVRREYLKVALYNTQRETEGRIAWTAKWKPYGHQGIEQRIANQQDFVAKVEDLLGIWSSLTWEEVRSQQYQSTMECQKSILDVNEAWNSTLYGYESDVEAEDASDLESHAPDSQPSEGLSLWGTADSRDEKYATGVLGSPLRKTESERIAEIERRWDAEYPEVLEERLDMSAYQFEEQVGSSPASRPLSKRDLERLRHPKISRRSRA